MRMMLAGIRFLILSLAWAWQDGPLFLSYWLWAFLCYYWLNPDLDISQGFRPGHFTFPFGPLLKALKGPAKKSLSWRILRSALRLLHEAANAVWRAFWAVFAILWTHRGLIHWPLLGTFLKSIYLACPLIFLLPLSERNVFELFLAYLKSPYFMIWVLSDALHIWGDYRDGKKRGSARFVPPPLIAPRGLFFRLFKGYRWY